MHKCTLQNRPLSGSGHITGHPDVDYDYYVTLYGCRLRYNFCRLQGKCRRMLFIQIIFCTSHLVLIVFNVLAGCDHMVRN